LRIAFNLRIPLEAVAEGSLPRFELKARRVEDRR
jgi:phenylacetate-CoA ligase